MDDGYFVFAGRDSRDMGITIEEFPKIAKPERRLTHYNVTGRLGSIATWDGGYNNVTISYKVWFEATAQRPLAQFVADLNAWLGSGGVQYQKLYDSYSYENINEDGVRVDRPYIREALFKGPLIVESTYNEIGSATIEFTCRPQLYLPGAFEEIPIGTAHYPTLDYNGIMGVRGCVAKPLILLTKPGTVKFHYGNPDNFRWIEVVMPEQDDSPRIFIDCEDETIYQVGDDGVKRSINGYCRAGGYTSISPFPEIPDPYEDPNVLKMLNICFYAASPDSSQTVPQDAKLIPRLFVL